jgi:hypothetical protein
MKNLIQKMERFAEMISEQTRAEFISRGFTNLDTVHSSSLEVKIIPGKKYTKIDVGRSGKYMVTSEGEIFGIKAYGVIHKGHQYGTLDTVDAYYWGDYTAKLRKTC